MAERDLGRGESPRVHARVVLLVTAAMLVALATVSFGLEVFFTDRIGVTAVEQRPFPAPGVTSDERGERLTREARQRRELDGEGGRMPIAAAMQAISAKGPHAFEPIGATR